MENEVKYLDHILNARCISNSSIELKLGRVIRHAYLTQSRKGKLTVPMIGTNIHAKIKATNKPHHGKPDLAAYVVPRAMPMVATKIMRYHQLDISL